MSKQLRVLISGASIAGPALAYWLVRAGCKVTVVERAPSLRSAGQGVDIRDTARDVIKRMGIFDTCKERSSHEEGIKIIDGSNQTSARFPTDTSGAGDSFSSDIEILRGELAMILFDITKENVEYIFGDTIDSLEDRKNDVLVHFSNGTPTTVFDLVVAADGLGSKTCRIAFEADSIKIKSINSAVAYFSIPPDETDTKWSRVHWFEGGRNVLLRPDNVGRTRAFLASTAYDKSDQRLTRFKQAMKDGVEAQKALFEDLYKDVGWEVPRVLKGMHISDDFYMQSLAQIYLKRWSSGRVTVVGDAGYAPSPVTGMGTSLAFIGAYVLAGEISNNIHDLPAALDSYERILRPYVESIQKLPPGVPWLFNPQSRWGIKVLETAAWTASLLMQTPIPGVLTKVAAFLPVWSTPFKLPEYEAFK